MTDYTPPLFDHALDQAELNRNLLWKQQQRQRAAYRQRVQTSLHGNSIARLQLRDRWQPWIDHWIDMNLPPLPPESETVPVTNQDLNW